MEIGDNLVKPNLSAEDPDFRPVHKMGVRSDYDDLETPRKLPLPATTHYMIVNVIFSVYGAILLLASAMFSLIFVGMCIFDYIPHGADAAYTAIVFGTLLGTFLTALSLVAYSQQSLRSFKILSILFCILGAAPVGGYFVFGWIGVYGLVVASQISVRKRFGLAIPEYFERLAKESAKEALFRDPTTQHELTLLKQKMVEESNAKFVPLSWIKIGGRVLVILLIIAATLLFPVFDEDEYFLLCFGFVCFLLFYYLTYLAFKWIQQRLNYKFVIAIMATHIILGTFPYLGVINYALGVMLLTTLLKPEIRSGYTKGVR